MRLLIFRSGAGNIGARFLEKLTLPERFKGTVVEKWLNYWQNLGRDYKDVALEICNGARRKPRKALFLGSTALATYGLAETNPDKEEFMQLLRYWNNQLMQVAPNMKNPASAEYLTLLESAVNQNRLRFASFGIFTLLWLDRYDANDCTYPALCNYTRVRFWQIPERVLDIGICGNYWRLQSKMHNFDINYL